MLVKVNKNQFLDNYEEDVQRHAYYQGMNITTYEVINKFVDEEISVDTLLEYIEKGYGIKINC